MVEQAKAFIRVKIADWAESWLLNMRQEHRASGRVLNVEERSAFAGYLKPDLLSAMRVVEAERIPNPPFFPKLPELGVPLAWDFSSEAGLSVVDTVVLVRSRVPEGRWLSALFHECVHLQQFQVLGVTRMVARYVNGLFENGFDYNKLPMERQAHELQFRFDSGLRVFSVEQEIETALLNGAI